MGDAWVDVADAIEGLRSALTEAIDAGAAQRMRFRLDPIDVTLNTVVTVDAHGKLGWKILEAGASRESANTQEIKLRLTPVWSSGEELVEQPLVTATLPSDGSSTPGAGGVATERDTFDG